MYSWTSPRQQVMFSRLVSGGQFFPKLTWSVPIKVLTLEHNVPRMHLGSTRCPLGCQLGSVQSGSPTHLGHSCQSGSQIMPCAPSSIPCFCSIGCSHRLLHCTALHRVAINLPVSPSRDPCWAANLRPPFFKGVTRFYHKKAALP